MKKFLLALTTLVAFATIMSCVIACDDNDDSAPDAGNQQDGRRVHLVAATADGPCMAGSVFYISELDLESLAVLDTITGVTNSRGEITDVQLKENTPYDIRVDCADFNEITNGVSDGSVVLNKFLMTGSSAETDAGIGDAGTGDSFQNGNVNDISHFIYLNVRTAFKNNAEHTFATYSTLNRAAFLALIPMLPFIVGPDGWENCNPDTLNIINGSSACNDMLLGVELVFRHYAVKIAAETSQSETGLLLQKLDSVMYDFEDSEFNSTGADTISKVTGAAATIDVNSAQENLSNHLSSVGGTAPNANNVLDMDGDEIPNADDADIDGDGFLNANDVAPYDAELGGTAEEPTFSQNDGINWQVIVSAEQVLWLEAEAYCDELTYAGYENWRLPTISELRSLIVGCPETVTGGECEVTDEYTETCTSDTVCHGCTQNAGPYSGCYESDKLEGECGSYWSGTACDDLGLHDAWSVCFNMADVSWSGDEISLLYTRCVREI
ncbi:MAG: DUF1566 domain-containing protein [Patescibacteria group bacterium]